MDDRKCDIIRQKGGKTMKITSIHIENILSYKDETINFNNDLNIFVGANGSGKSNLMNIIIYILKRFCLKNYEITLTRGIEMIEYKKYVIREKIPIYGDNEEHFLAKNKNLSNKDRAISFKIKFEDQDIKNLNEIFKHKETIYKFLSENIESIQFNDDKYSVQPESIKEFFEIEERDLKKGEDIEIKIIEEDKKLKVSNDRKENYMIYMKYFSLIYELLNLIGVKHNVKNTFIFFEAYRNNSKETTKVGIAKYENHQYSNLQSLQNIKSLAYSIGTKSSYIMLATKKFGRILRYSIEQEDGREKFNKNKEYLKLKEFFKKFNYDINIECIDKEDNIYQFYLKRKGMKVEIDLISSGEREIINFIFGLFLEEIKDGIVIIDEPELHLHPNWQKKLIEILKKENCQNNIQMMFVTHSASFINYNLLNNIFRIYMNNDGFSRHIKISDMLNKKVEEDVRKKLNIINATNNEKIFFSKAVILVEGITDVILFKKIFEEEIDNNTTDVEFININGKNNLNNFTSILDKLEIPWFYIGDNDNLREFEETKRYFEFDTKNATKDCSSKNKTYYCMNLLNEIENIVNGIEKDNKKLIDSYMEYKKNVLKKSTNLSKEDEDIINNFINSKYTENIYILKKGEIEDYLKVGKKNKALGFDKAIKVASDENEYRNIVLEDDFKELIFIIKDIANKLMNI